MFKIMKTIINPKNGEEYKICVGFSRSGYVRKYADHCGYEIQYVDEGKRKRICRKKRWVCSVCKKEKRQQHFKQYDNFHNYCDQIERGSRRINICNECREKMEAKNNESTKNTS